MQQNPSGYRLGNTRVLGIQGRLPPGYYILEDFYDESGNRVYLPLSEFAVWLNQASTSELKKLLKNTTGLDNDWIDKLSKQDIINILYRVGNVIEKPNDLEMEEHYRNISHINKRLGSNSSMGTISTGVYSDASSSKRSDRSKRRSKRSKRRGIPSSRKGNILFSSPNNRNIFSKLERSSSSSLNNRRNSSPKLRRQLSENVMIVKKSPRIRRFNSAPEKTREKSGSFSRKTTSRNSSEWSE